MLLTLFDIRAQFALNYGLLRFQWQPAQAARRRFQVSMRAVGQLLEQGDVRQVILDLHGLPNLELGEQLWLAANWLARVSVPSIEQVALVLPPGNVYNHMVVESLLRAGRAFIHYEVQFFGTVPEALDWVVGQHDPTAQLALEQEWNGQAVVAALHNG